MLVLSFSKLDRLSRNKIYLWPMKDLEKSGFVYIWCKQFFCRKSYKTLRACNFEKKLARLTFENISTWV
jgi:hypothetical protein